MKKIIIIVILVVIVGIQFIRPDKTKPVYDLSKDLFEMDSSTLELESLMKNTCYDCHSNESSFPWYSEVAPVSWMLNNHIKEARSHINFSEWGNYSAEKQSKMIEECIEEIESGEMPLKSYTLMHKGAKLNKEQKAMLINWLEGI